MYFFHIFWGCHFYYGSDLIKVGLDTPLRHHESKEFSCHHPKSALSRMELHIVRTKGVECFPKIFQVIFFSLAFHQYVVLIDLDISPNLLCEHLVHEGYVAPAFLRLNGITLYEEALASDK